MTAFIARVLLWLIFGYFVTDIINELKVFDEPVRWYAVVGPVMLLFGLQESFLKRLEIKRQSSTDSEFEQSIWFRTLCVVMWIFVICLLISIPLVWWGLIKKAITAGDQWNWQAPIPR